MKKVFILFLTLFLSVTAIALAGEPSVTSSDAATLSALVSRDAPNAVFHIGEARRIFSRLGESFFLDAVLGGRAKGKHVIARLKNLPIESFSLAKGMMLEDQGMFHGAVRFSEGQQKVFSELQTMTEFEDLSVLTRKFASLMGLSESSFSRESELMFTVLQGRANLYYLLIGIPMISTELYVSIGDSGKEKFLLFASNEELIEKTKNAFEKGQDRMKISRRADGVNFVQLNDTSDGKMTKDTLEGLIAEAKAPAFFELSAALDEEKINIQLCQNIFDVFFGSKKNTEWKFSAGDPGLQFGGGSPFFSAVINTFLSNDEVFELLGWMTGAKKEDINQFLTDHKIDVSAFSSALRSAGAVIGTKDFAACTLPGGYAFISGNPESWRAIIPFVKPLLGLDSGAPFEIVDMGI